MNAPARCRAIIFGLLCFLNLQLLVCAGQSTAFTYQGRLSDGGAPANGTYDLQFAIYDAANNGNLASGLITNSATSVSNGLFTVAVDFGAAIFDGSGRWLEIAVRTNGPGNFTNLTARQPITATPYAIQALRAAGVAASNITGTVTLTQLPAGVVTNGANVALLNANQTFSGMNVFSANVGIGISSPAASLQVAGGIIARGGPPGGFGLNNNGLTFAGNGGDNDSGMSSSANGQIEFYNNSIEAMRILNGNVGIGTIQPSAPLEVSAANGFPQLRISVPTNSPYGAFLSIDASSTTNGKDYLIFSTGNAAGEGQGKLIIQNHSDSLEIMGITSNGNVGIGTVSPASKLQVVGNIQLGNGGASFAASAPENLRIVRGTINSAGAIVKGSGFTVNHPGTGTYVVTFTTPFSDVPTITATAVNAVVRAGAVISASSVNIGTASFGGASADDSFHFIAIGPP